MERIHAGQLRCLHYVSPRASSSVHVFLLRFPGMEMKQYEAEWCLRENQFESYEKHALYIKLSSILMLFVSEALNIHTALVFLILMILWLQDAIWKTFQSRLEPRLLQIEKSIKKGAPDNAFQFNTEYQLVETSGLLKIKEYAKQAVRPTIAFPHVILVIIVIGCSIVS